MRRAFVPQLEARAVQEARNHRSPDRMPPKRGSDSPGHCESRCHRTANCGPGGSDRPTKAHYSHNASVGAWGDFADRGRLWVGMIGEGFFNDADRIVFRFAQNPESGEEEIFLLAIGSHDEFY